MTKEVWITGPLKGTCKRCGEDDRRGLVTDVKDGRGVQKFCAVCGHSWWVAKGA